MNNYTQLNALRGICQQCNSEIAKYTDTLKKCAQKEKDAITGPIVAKFSKLAKGIGFNHRQFIHQLGVINKRFEDR